MIWLDIFKKDAEQIRDGKNVQDGRSRTQELALDASRHLYVDQTYPCLILCITYTPVGLSSAVAVRTDSILITAFCPSQRPQTLRIYRLSSSYAVSEIQTSLAYRAKQLLQNEKKNIFKIWSIVSHVLFTLSAHYLLVNNKRFHIEHVIDLGRALVQLSNEL